MFVATFVGFEEFREAFYRIFQAMQMLYPLLNCFDSAAWFNLIFFDAQHFYTEPFKKFRRFVLIRFTHNTFDANLVIHVFIV